MLPDITVDLPQEISRIEFEDITPSIEVLQAPFLIGYVYGKKNSRVNPLPKSWNVRSNNVESVITLRIYPVSTSRVLGRAPEPVPTQASGFESRYPDFAHHSLWQRWASSGKARQNYKESRCILQRDSFVLYRLYASFYS